ncbi:hypothetical protein JXJ21_05625 [candidate division KSB1 bacterium]|nr:hypothetical protein [candidate division KSB1 bacterium]
MKYSFPDSVFFMLCCATAILIGCTSQTEQDSKAGPCGKLYKHVEIKIEEPDVLHEQEQQRKQVVEKFDKQGLLYSARVMIDQSDSTLAIPDNAEALIVNDFFVAKTPSKIEFGIIPVKPKFFGNPPGESHLGVWSSWSQGNYDPKTGKFYAAIGNHQVYDAYLYIVEYDPANRIMKLSTEINRLLGRQSTQMQDGKIHGWLDFYPPDSPNLWFCTYWCRYPEPTEKDYATGYQGGYIMSYNVETGDFIDYGVPMLRSSWPYHRIDTQRGMLYAVGMFGEFLAWDIKEQKTHFAGYLPDCMGWFERAMMLDSVTGFVYTSNRAESDIERHLVKYDPATNRFTRLECHMPLSKDKENKKLKNADHIRAWTANRGPDGLLWGVTLSGELFSFDPETEKILERGTNWRGVNRYTTTMARSPRGRYIYYSPGAHGKSYAEGAPVIQYDTLTGKKKILAFLFPYYYQKYGYTTGGSFSIKLDEDGKRLFIVMNGAFIDIEDHTRKKHQDVFGHCSIFLIHIPESERAE